MATNYYLSNNHDAKLAASAGIIAADQNIQFTYTFENFFHPFIGELIAKLNGDSLSGMLAEQLDPALKQEFFQALYNPYENALVQVGYTEKEIDVSCGPYANYNWELFFHIPLTIAVHLSKNQRFAEAQRWFHYIFDPTSNDQTANPSDRFWKFLAFRDPDNSQRIEEIVRLLSIPDDKNNSDQQSVLNDYQAILDNPFQPHAVARGRHLAYQYCVVMKYLDNLIAWGDQLFQQDTVESINEATQMYVLAANILGECPQRIPPFGFAKPQTFAQLKRKGLGKIGDALVELEGQFPFNNTLPDPGKNEGVDSSPVFGIGRALYFCIPRNDKLLGYWDIVADRLFKIRHSMNFQGVVRPLALFDPPIDPGMLVKAAAAGIDIGSIVSGLNQPIGPVRSLVLIQKALELCGEVRGFGSALLSALEKGDAERLALVRQRHEIQIQQMAQEVRFLQWKSAQETTKSLLTSRNTVLERLHFYQRLLGLPADPNAPDSLSINEIELTEGNFDDAYSNLVGQYDKLLSLQKLPDFKPGDSSPGIISGYSGNGKIYLSKNEDKELNVHLPLARDARLAGSALNLIVSTLAVIPDFKIDLHYWGIGGTTDITGGTKLAYAGKILADICQITAAWEQDQAGMTSRYASYERRADEWLLQHNLAAHEVMQIGRQILTSLIAEQIAHHEYLSIQQQIANAQEVDQVLHDKFTNEDLYLWMQGEISRLYYEYYRFAFDTARKAERTMKQELMRPEVDARDFVQFNYWDGGRKGLLSGEALYLDVKRMEMAYHDNNKRELELTKHVSLRQLNPIALLALKTTGTCQVTIPEWLYDLDCRGHYMRRIKNVALSIPSVVGPYTNVNCTLSLLKSSLRKSPILKEGEYVRQGSEDDRFVDFVGAIQSIVTSGGQNDSGMFETNLRDERFLPFEGAGAESTWKLDLPIDYPAFDFSTISDVILHIRYTARQGVEPAKVKETLDAIFQEASHSNLELLFSLRHDYPTEWSAFVNASDSSPFMAAISRDYFPYFTQGKTITIDGIQLYDGENVSNNSTITVQGNWSDDLNNKKAFDFSCGTDHVLKRSSDAEIFLIVHYSLS